jgi:hypothetical protein
VQERAFWRVQQDLARSFLGPGNSGEGSGSAAGGRALVRRGLAIGQARSSGGGGGGGGAGAGGRASTAAVSAARFGHGGGGGGGGGGSHADQEEESPGPTSAPPGGRRGHTMTGVTPASTRSLPTAPTAPAGGQQGGPGVLAASIDRLSNSVMARPDLAGIMEETAAMQALREQIAMAEQYAPMAVPDLKDRLVQLISRTALSGGTGSSGRATEGGGGSGSGGGGGGGEGGGGGV